MTSAITKDAIKALIGSLKHCTHLQELNVSNINLAGIKCLVDSLTNLSDLRVLSLSANNIGSEGIKTLTSSLKIHCPNLSELYLNNNNIREDDISLDCENLSVLNIAHNGICDHRIAGKNVSLCEFNISHNPIRAHNLTSALEHCIHICDLNLSSIELGNSGAEYLAKLLMSFNTVQNLRIDHNNLGPGAREVVKRLKYCTNIRELYVGSNGIDDLIAGTLADILSMYCTKLCVLDISSNSICSNGVNAMAKLFTHCPYLQELNVSGNCIHDDIEKFSQSLKNAVHLHKLDISNNNLGGPGTTLLCDGLIYCKHLVHLCISNNSLSLDGTKVLAEVIGHFPILYVLDLGNNGIKDSGAVTLANALLRNNINSLGKLYMNFNLIKPTGAEALVKALQECPSLVSLDLNYNPIGVKCAESIRATLNCPDLRVANVSSYVHVHSVSTVTS